MALTHTARSGDEIRIGHTRILLLQASNGTALLLVVEGEKRRKVHISGQDVHHLETGSVRLHWARRGAARLALSAPPHIRIRCDSTRTAHACTKQ